MKRNREKTKEQLTHELADLRQRITELEVSESKCQQAQSELEKAQQQLRTIFESVSDGVAFTDLELRILDMNEAGLRMFGYDHKEEAIGRSGLELISPKEHVRAIADMQNTLETGHSDTLEYTFVDKKGTEFLAEYNVIVIKDESGSPAGFVGTMRDTTERKQAEEALRESEQEKTAILESLTELVAYQDTDMKILWANKSARESVGLTEKELVGHYCYELWPKRSEPCVDCPVVKARETGQPQSAEMATPDGKQWLIRGYPVFDQAGQILGIVEVTMDATERKQYINQQELIINILQILNKPGERTGLLRDILIEIKKFAGVEAVGIRLKEGDDYPYICTNGFVEGHVEAENSLCAYDLDGQLLRDEIGNPVLECMCGNIICGRFDPQKPFFTTGGSFWTNCTTELLATTTEEDRQARTRNKCNGEGYESVALIPIRSDSRIVGLLQLNDTRRNMFTLDMIQFFENVGAGIGITFERMQTQEALRESEQIKSAILNATPDLVAVLDKDFAICEINRAMAERFGKQPEELIGRCGLDLMALELAESRKRYFNDVFQTGQPCRWEDINQGAYFDNIAYPVLEEQGQTTRIAIVARDITEQKRQEEERLRMERLESIGTLAGGIAHDFNNLLTGIMGNIGLAKRYIEPKGKAAERLDEAERASLRARDLTQQLLTFSRGGTPVKKPISISALIKESAAFALRGSKVRSQFLVPEDLWTVEADEGQISQVIHNLVKNADEAMPGGGVVDISARNITVKDKSALPVNKGRYVLVTVADRGVGISKEYLPRIFEPYFSTKQQGSGLGLATAYSIVKNHGGHINVESEQNEGTTVYVYLPASKKQVSKKKGAEEIQPTFIGQGRILVIDDEETIREFLQRALTNAGYEVEITGDGREAIRLYTHARETKQPFNAVIMDLTIPGGMGGKETIKQLLEIDPEVKAIVSSGYATDPIMSEYKKYGFSAVAPKPYRIAEIENILRDLLKS